jgi:RNA polymerase sigma factor (TIGR02999 family)
MSTETSSTDVLAQLRKGKRQALDDLLPLVYKELRSIAHRHLGARVGDATLRTTGLVHEVYLKLVDQANARWNDRAHFLALASLAMRQVMVDRARARMALKRGGTQRHLTLDAEVIADDDQPESLLQLHEALNRLAEVEPRLAQIVECRFFGGLSEEEIAEALGLVVRTVQRDWTKARILLRRALSP